MRKIKQLKLPKLISALLLCSFIPSTVTAAQVFVTDVVVQGSLCTGFDCVNGESFGFDTLRLKENNLRIHFQDTSVSASFPSNDWRLLANDTGNGGGNFFAIEDSTAGRQIFRVDAGAPANSLRVDSAGDVGVGNSNPIVELHVTDGDSPTLRLEQNGSSGFTAQSFDIVSNEANFFIRDVTNGSQLPFRIKPGADTDSLFIAADNNIGMGTDSPQANLDIKGAGPAIRLSDTTSTAFNWEIFVNGNQDRFNIGIPGGNTPFKIDDGANNNLLQLGVSSADQVDITGSLVISGQCSEVDGACADYVFEPGYEKLSLTQLEKYIRNNKHLPNIPSAAEMQENGVSVAHISGRLLEKVEELVLYTLEQQETIEKLQSRIAALEANNKIAMTDRN